MCRRLLRRAGPLMVSPLVSWFSTSGLGVDLRETDVVLLVEEGVRVLECRVAEEVHVLPQRAGCRIQGSGFRVQGSGCRVQESGCRVQDSGFRV
jgi:hypothetical protein